MCRLQYEFSNLPSCASLRGTLTNVTISIGCRHTCQLRTPSCNAIELTILNTATSRTSEHFRPLTKNCTDKKNQIRFSSSLRTGRSTLKAKTPPPISKFFRTLSLSPEVNYIKPLPICSNKMQTQEKFRFNCFEEKPHQLLNPTSRNRNHARKIAVRGRRLSAFLRAPSSKTVRPRTQDNKPAQFKWRRRAKPGWYSSIHHPLPGSEMSITPMLHLVYTTLSSTPHPSLIRSTKPRNAPRGPAWMRRLGTDDIRGWSSARAGIAGGSNRYEPKFG